VKHHLVVHRTRDKDNESLWESLPQCSEKWDGTKHIAELVVLSDDEDIADGVEGDFSDVFVRKEEAEKGA
jgi:UV DNA damage repair endonuclease